MATLDLRRQFFSEDRHLLALRGSDVCRKVYAGIVFMSERSEEQQVGQLARAQPRKLVALLRATECEAPVTIEAVPAQCGDVELFAAYGFHGIPEDRLYASELYEHGEVETLFKCP